MMKWKRTSLGLVAATLLLILTVALAQSATGFRIDRFVIAGGGGDLTSASYRLQGTLGQSIAHSEPAVSGSYRVQGGFWPPPAADAPPGTPTPSDHRIYLPLVFR